MRVATHIQFQKALNLHYPLSLTHLTATEKADYLTQLDATTIVDENTAIQANAVAKDGQTAKPAVSTLLVPSTIRKGD